MIDELRAMVVFAKTVETGSFRAAARALGVSPSVVSHHLTHLEARLGVALLYRSTRSLSLTPGGQTLIEHARIMLAAAENGLNAIAQRSAEPAGSLSLTLPAFLARSPLIDGIAAFARAHPKVSLALDFSDVRQDLIGEGIDLAIRIGPLADSGLKSKRLFAIDRCLIASPALVASRSAAQTPGDLIDWPWIGVRMRANQRTLTNAAGEQRRVDFDPAIVVNSIDAARQLALAGIGLATPPTFLVDEDLRQGRLLEPLPGWRVSSLGAYAVWPANTTRASLTYRLIGFLEGVWGQGASQTAGKEGQAGIEP